MPMRLVGRCLSIRCCTNSPRARPRAAGRWSSWYGRIHDSLSIQIFSRLGPYVNTSFPLRRRPHRPLGQSEWQLERSTSTHPNCNLAVVGDPIRYFAGVLYYVQDFTDRCALLLLSLP